MLKGAYIMKLNSKLKIVSVMVLFLMVGLAGCGKSKQAVKAQNKTENVSITNNNRVWFVVSSDEGVKKDAQIWNVLYVKNGKVKEFNTEYSDKFILQNAVKMSQGEIISEADQADKKYVTDENAPDERAKFVSMNPSVTTDNDGKNVRTENIKAGIVGETNSATFTFDTDQKHESILGHALIGYGTDNGSFEVLTLAKNKNEIVTFNSPKDKSIKTTTNSDQDA